MHHKWIKVLINLWKIMGDQLPKKTPTELLDDNSHATYLLWKENRPSPEASLANWFLMWGLQSDNQKLWQRRRTKCFPRWGLQNDKETLQIDSWNLYLNMTMPPMKEAQRDVPSAVEKHTKCINRMIPDIPTAACSPFFSCTISVSCTGYKTNPAAAHAITTPKFVNHPITQRNLTQNLPPSSPRSSLQTFQTHNPTCFQISLPYWAPNVCVITKWAMANSAQGLKDKSDLPGMAFFIHRTQSLPLTREQISLKYVTQKWRWPILLKVWRKNLCHQESFSHWYP